jgi:hypothetical protein
VAEVAAIAGVADDALQDDGVAEPQVGHRRVVEARTCLLGNVLEGMFFGQWPFRPVRRDMFLGTGDALLLDRLEHRLGAGLLRRGGALGLLALDRVPGDEVAAGLRQADLLGPLGGEGVAAAGVGEVAVGGVAQVVEGDGERLVAGDGAAAEAEGAQRGELGAGDGGLDRDGAGRAAGLGGVRGAHAAVRIELEVGGDPRVVGRAGQRREGHRLAEREHLGRAVEPAVVLERARVLAAAQLLEALARGGPQQLRGLDQLVVALLGEHVALAQVGEQPAEGEGEGRRGDAEAEREGAAAGGAHRASQR